MGELFVNLKERIKTILDYKQPAFWMAALTVIICGVIAVLFLTDPKDQTYRLKELNAYGKSSSELS